MKQRTWLGEQTQLSPGPCWRLDRPLIVEHGTAAQRARDTPLVSECGIEVGSGRQTLFDCAHEPIEALHSIPLVVLTQLRALQPAPQHRDRFVVGRQRHRERMPVLSAKREGKSRRIVEPCRRAVHDLCHQRESL